MENAQAERTLPIGSAWLRVSAVLVDAAIVVLIDLALATAMSGGGTSERTALAVFLVVSAVYQIGFWTALSATPGKMLMGLYVADKSGGRITPDKAILRYLVLLIGGAVGIGHVISLVLIFVDPKRRAIHDRVAGTLVLRVTEESQRLS
jgi:uncharacterized RDD family membrane protein YckC